MILVDLLIIAIVAYSVYLGFKRGLMLVALELVSFASATFLGLIVYRPLGLWLREAASLPVSLANIAAYMLVWSFAEVVIALIIRFWLLPKLSPRPHQSKTSQIAGAVLNGAKATVFIAIGLSFFVGLPLASSTKQAVTNSLLGRALLAQSGNLQHWLDNGLGRDLSEGVNFFTVPAEPQDTRRIPLGFTTTNVRVDGADEQKMLELVNAERTSRGLKPLVTNDKARDVGRAYAKKMLAEGYFSHFDANGRNPFDRLRSGGVVFVLAAENLALAPTLPQAHQGLMNSPGHRAHILSPLYRTVGIGIIDAGPYGLMVTQEFTD